MPDHTEITIEVEDGARAVVIDPFRARSRYLKLSTLEPHQKTAILRFYSRIGEEERPLVTLPVTGLTPSGQELTTLRLDVRASRRLFAGPSLRLHVSVNGELRAERRVRLPREFRRTLPPPPAAPVAAALLILLIGAGGWLVLRNSGLAAGLFGRSGAQSSVGANTVGRTAMKVPNAQSAPAAAGSSVPTSPTDPKAIEPNAVTRSGTSSGTSEGRSGAAVDEATWTLTVYFQPDLAELTPEAESALGDAYSMLAQSGFPTLTVNGHCALEGTEAGRMELSVHRAENVSSYLRSLGYPKSAQIRTRGYGATKPVTTDPAREYLNRRVVIEIGATSE